MKDITYQLSHFWIKSIDQQQDNSEIEIEDKET